MIRMVKPLSLMFVLLFLVSLCALPCAAKTAFEIVEAPLSEERLPLGTGSAGAVLGARDERVTPEKQAQPEDPAVAGVSDETPDAVSIFWGVVIALLIAGAAIFGIVMLVPRDTEEDT